MSRWAVSLATALLLLVPALPARSQDPAFPSTPAALQLRVSSPNLFPGRGPQSGVRIKDLARLAGINSHTLTGYGLVAGLAGTGDSSTALSSPMMQAFLNRFGFPASPAMTARLKSRNVALVAVTAQLPAYARSGDPLDVRVASLGDATDLGGGTLLLSLLRGPDGQVYASAQGAVLAGDGERTGRSRRPVVGEVPGGGTVSRSLDSPALQRERLLWVLHHPDFTTAARIAAAINLAMGPVARAVSPQMVEVRLKGVDPVSAVAVIGELEVQPERVARVVCDERTGTVVAGREVRLRPALVSHRGLTLEITEEGAELRAVVEALNQAGASPSDVIAVLRALRRAGSLSGEVVLR